MSDNEQAQWEAIDRLSERQGMTEQAIAVLKHEQENQRQQNERQLELMTRIETKIDRQSQEAHEMRGGLAVLRWVGGMAAALSGAAVALWVWVNGGGAS